MVNWESLLSDALKINGETWEDVEQNTMSEADMKRNFDSGFGGTKGCEFTVWTKNHVYFPACYDGSEWVAWVARNPNGLPTPHIGG